MIKLYNADALTQMQSMQDSGIKFDCFITDPPYSTTRYGHTGGGGMFQEQLTKSGKVFKHNDIDIADWLPLAIDLANESCHFYIMVNQKNLIHYLNVVNSSSLTYSKLLVWKKNNKVMNQYYMSQAEFIIFARKGKAKRINNCSYTDVLEVDNIKTKDINGKNIHNVQKPVELFKIFVENSTNQGDMVFDPFAGVGTTALACMDLGRKCIAVEIDPKYHNIATELLANKEKVTNPPALPF